LPCASARCFDLGAVQRDATEIHQAGLFAKMQNLCELASQHLQVTLAKIRDGAKMRRIETGNADEIHRSRQAVLSPRVGLR
jgi:hypothetical protein